MKLVHWMNRPVGRWVRSGAGLALIALGLALGGGVGVALALVGVVPLVAGAAGVCLVAPVLRMSSRER